MSIENGSHGKNGNHRRGRHAFKALREIGEKMSQGMNLKATEPVAHSQTANDPRYEEYRKRFERDEVPLELMDYALGFKDAAKDSPEYFKLREYEYKIDRIREQASQAHYRRLGKDPEYEAHWKAVGKAWVERNTQHIPEDLRAYTTGEKPIPSGDEGEKIAAQIKQYARFGVAIPVNSYDRSKPKDLPAMPKEIQDRIRNNPAAVNYAILRFTQLLKDWQFKNPTTKKFAELFSDNIEGKAHRENPGKTDRSRYENAYWALKHLDLIKETWSKNKKRPEITLRGFQVAHNIEDFLLFEKIRRLEEAKSEPNANSKEIDTEISRIRSSAEYLDARARFYKNSVPEEVIKNPSLFESERPTTFIEAVGNRLWSPASELPIDETKISEEHSKIKIPDITPDIEEINKNLQFAHERLSFLSRKLSISAANLSNDVRTMSEYLRDGGTWDQGVQDGFELVLRELSENLKHAKVQIRWATDALQHDKITKEGTEMFTKHLEHIRDLNKSLHDTMHSALTLWSEYQMEAQQPRATEQEVESAPQPDTQAQEFEAVKRKLESELSAALSALEELRADASMQREELKNLRAQLEQNTKKAQETIRALRDDAALRIEEFEVVRDKLNEVLNVLGKDAPKGLSEMIDEIENHIANLISEQAQSN